MLSDVIITVFQDIYYAVGDMTASACLGELMTLLLLTQVAATIFLKQMPNPDEQIAETQITGFLQISGSICVFIKQCTWAALTLYRRDIQ